MPSMPVRIDQAPVVHRAIADASRRTGMGFDFLYNQARVESALNPAAKAKTSTASGLFQFTRQTWLATVKTSGQGHGLDWAANAIEQQPNGRYIVRDPQLRQAILDLRFDANAASAMAAEFASDNRDFLSARLGREVEDVDLYLAHFLGAHGAARFLEAHDAAPDSAAAPLFPDAAAANRPIFYRRDGTMQSFAQIRAGFAAKMNGKVPPPTGQLMMASQAVSSHSGTHSNISPSPAMRGLEAMPGRLSLSFASAAYRRLAELGTA